MSKRDCPCEYCDCTTISYVHMIDPCPDCLMTHEEYDDYNAGLGIKENKEWGNIPNKTDSRHGFGDKQT